jgi:hypothetical protein
MATKTFNFHQRLFFTFVLVFYKNYYTVKKVSDFTFPSRDVTSIISMDRKNLIIPGQAEFGK